MGGGGHNPHLPFPCHSKHQGGLWEAKPLILGVPVTSLQTQRASTTIQPQEGIPCSESYKLNKFQIFDGINPIGLFYCPMGQPTMFCNRYLTIELSLLLLSKLSTWSRFLSLDCYFLFQQINVFSTMNQGIIHNVQTKYCILCSVLTSQ